MSVDRVPSATRADVTGKSALQLAGALQAGVLDATAVAAATLAAIADCGDPAIFTLLTAQRARTEAAAAAARLAAGRPASLLDGVPVAWKDLFALEGHATTAGAKVTAGDPPAPEDAAVVRRLKAAGMVTAGRVNMTEFAFSGVGINPHYGTPRNPWGGAVARIPGGSSSGSGVAVARGLVPVSIGTDTGGSVRIPAALNGVVGYKATRGRYPMDGVFPLSRQLDSLGVLCRTVADALVVDAALCARPVPAVQAAPVAGRRIVVPETVVFDDSEPEVVAAAEAAIARLSAAGARVERRPMPALARVLGAQAEHGALVTAEAYVQHRHRLEGPQAAGMDPRVVQRARHGADIALADYITLTDIRTRMIAETEADIGDALLAFPTVVRVAPRLDPLLADDVAFFSTNALMLRNTLIGNFLDWCGLSLPCGFGAGGLPAGLLLSAPAGRDDDLLAFGLTAEALVREAAGA